MGEIVEMGTMSSRGQISIPNDIRKEIDEIKEKVIDIVAELESAAKREEVKVLEKYINFWNPVKFVTQNEAEAIVREILKQEKDKSGKEK